MTIAHHLNETHHHSVAHPPTESFGGHILPGTSFLFLGLWWLFGALEQHFNHLVNKKSSRFRCLTNYQIKGWPNNFEPKARVFLTIVGMIIETVDGIIKGSSANFHNIQHFTMYFFFGLSGLIDLLIAKDFPLPDGLNYFGLALSFAIEGLLFAYHLHGRPPFDVQIHTLLVLIIFTCSVSVLVEWNRRNHVLAGLFKAICTLVQGTWFWQIAFNLYPPLGLARVDQHDHMEVMMITTKFCWHVAAVVVFVGLTYCFYHRRYKHLLNADTFQSVQYSMCSVEEEENTEQTEKRQ